MPKNLCFISASFKLHIRFEWQCLLLMYMHQDVCTLSNVKTWILKISIVTVNASAHNVTPQKHKWQYDQYTAQKIGVSRKKYQELRVVISTLLTHISTGINFHLMFYRKTVVLNHVLSYKHTGMKIFRWW